MRVFVTGATGFVGSAVVDELLRAGHDVIGLARSDAGADALDRMGARTLRGSLDDVDSLRSGVADADGVIHTAFDHDFSRFAESCEQDRRVIEALGEAIAGSDRPLVVTSGVALLAFGRIATEGDRAPTPSPAYPRASEPTADLLATRGIRASTVRLPPTVHGDGDHGFVPLLALLAREKGVSAYVDGGLNRWPAVHRLDAAKVFRHAVERGMGDERYHAVAEEGVPFRHIAEAIGRNLGLPAVSVPAGRASDHFGWFAIFASMDVPASSTWTRDVLGWQPDEVPLLTDIDRPDYYDA